MALMMEFKTTCKPVKVHRNYIQRGNKQDKSKSKTINGLLVCVPTVLQRNTHSCMYRKDKHTPTLSVVILSVASSI